MKPLFPRLASLIIALCFSSALHAAAPMYTIELLLFEHVGGHSDELWPEYPGAPDLSRVVDLEARAGMPIDEAAIDPSFVPRPRGKLTALAEAMKRAGGYRILEHLAWRQPSYGERRTRPIRIEAGAQIPGTWLPPAERPLDEWSAVPSAPGDPLSHHQLEGTAKVHVGKYLHLELDLLFHRNRPQPAVGETGDDPGPVMESRLDVSRPLMETIRVRGHRRMRSKEIHYLDHPLIGALVIAHPHDPEEESAAAE